MLNNIGLPGLLLIAIVVLVLFGRGKISSLMGEAGKGIAAFKHGLKDDAEGTDGHPKDSIAARHDLPSPHPGTPNTATAAKHHG